MTAAPADVDVRHVPSLDGVRAIAAYAVIATHVGFETGKSVDQGPFAPMLARMEFGVTLFFLLSGFLLFRPFARASLAGVQHPHWGSFWWRRLLRIMPASWLMVLVTLGLGLTDTPPTPALWRSSLLLTQIYDRHYDRSLSHMWTLGVELSFYAALPFLALLGRLIRPRDPLRGYLLMLAVMAGTALTVNLVVHAHHITSPRLQWLPVFLDWFGLGMVLALVSLRPAGEPRWFATLRELAAAPGPCWIAGALLYWLSTLPLAGPLNLASSTTWEWTLRHNLYGAAAFFFVLPVMAGNTRWVGRMLGNPVVSWLGTVSYGVYLWHLPLMIALARWFHWRLFGGHFLELFLLTAASATAAAAVSWYLLERPLLRRFSRPWRTVRGDTDRLGASPAAPPDAAEHDRRDGQQAEQLQAGSAGPRVG